MPSNRMNSSTTNKGKGRDQDNDKDKDISKGKGKDKTKGKAKDAKSKDKDKTKGKATGNAMAKGAKSKDKDEGKSLKSLLQRPTNARRQNTGSEQDRRSKRKRTRKVKKGKRQRTDDGPEQPKRHGPTPFMDADRAFQEHPTPRRSPRRHLDTLGKYDPRTHRPRSGSVFVPESQWATATSLARGRREREAFERQRQSFEHQQSATTAFAPPGRRRRRSPPLNRLNQEVG